MSLLILPCPNTGQQSRTTTGPLRRAHLTFAAWFWEEINARSTELIDEITRKATELQLWHDEHVGAPDWVERGESGPPPGWHGRLWKAGLRVARYVYGTRGFRVWEVDIDGVIVLEKDDDWTPLPSRYHG